jgi:hypothetical protein
MRARDDAAQLIISALVYSEQMARTMASGFQYPNGTTLSRTAVVVAVAPVSLIESNLYAVPHESPSFCCGVQVQD